MKTLQIIEEFTKASSTRPRKKGKDGWKLWPNFFFLLDKDFSDI